MVLLKLAVEEPDSEVHVWCLAMEEAGNLYDNVGWHIIAPAVIDVSGIGGIQLLKH